jgi:hypothetical protein
MAALNCHIHAEITTEDDKKIALFAAGVLNFRATRPSATSART